MDDWTPEMDEAFNEIEKQSNLGKQILKEIEQDWRKNASEYERGFIDGMQKQMQSSVDRAVNAMGKREWVGLTEEEARVKFESWHKAEYVQPLERYGHTYKNMHVRNRWQGWLAANGIKEKQND